MEPFYIFFEAGQSLAVINCGACDHRTPRTGVCLQCQPSPEIFQCYGCMKRGGIPTPVTIPTWPTNDPPIDPNTVLVSSTFNNGNPVVHKWG
jgi:hypothetical protein